MDLDGGGAVLEGVVFGDGVEGEFPFFAHDRQGLVELVSEGTADEEAAGVDGGHDVDGVAGAIERESLDHDAEGLGIVEKGGDVAKVDAGLGPVAHGADAGFKVTGERLVIHGKRPANEAGEAVACNGYCAAGGIGVGALGYSSTQPGGWTGGRVGSGVGGMSTTADLRIHATKPLIAPAVLAEEWPLDEAGAQVVHRARRDISAVMRGADDRLLVVVGPCSIHDPAAAVEYAERLRPVAARLAGELLIAMRVYFEKPRTVVGWKGLINDPGLDGSYQVNRGLRLARRLVLDVTARGLPVATEFLDTTLGQYFAEAVSWAAIGARTVESQVHRELASGLSMPVGFKNRTDGDVQVAVDAIRSAAQPHWFPSLTAEGAPAVMGTTGNPDTHVVLRGGAAGPNYDGAARAAVVALLGKHGLPPHVMVDCSHANSGKDAARQPAVAAELAAAIAAGDRSIAAVMLESYLVGGSQNADTVPRVYGQSITDGCLGWKDTVPVLETLAAAVRARRGRTE